MFTGKTAKKTLALTTALFALAPITAFAAPQHGFDFGNVFGGRQSTYQSQQDNRQHNKNTWRNLGTAGAAIAAYGLLNHNSTATLLGAAGAAYSANRYEQDRQSQSQQQNGYNNDRYNNNRDNRRRY